MNTMTIGKIAKLADVGIETIRFYEREQLIAVPSRSASGYRQYPTETVKRLRFIKRAKELGFSLKEIKELLSLQIEPNTTCKDIRKRAELKIENIQEKIQTLKKMDKSLRKLTEACKSRGPVTECPILEALED